MGVEAMLESVDLVKAGKAPRIKQDEALATYEGRCGPGNAKIDWGKPWEQIDRLIRGCNPAPGAWTTLDGKTLKIFDAKPLPAKDPKGIAGKLGEIVAVEADGFTVVCADGRFKVTRVQPADGKKLDAGEWAKSANIATGAKFTGDLARHSLRVIPRPRLRRVRVRRVAPGARRRRTARPHGPGAAVPTRSGTRHGAGGSCPRPARCPDRPHPWRQR